MIEKGLIRFAARGSREEGEADCREVAGGAILRQSDGRRVHIVRSVAQEVPFPLPGMGGMMDAATLATTSGE